MKRRSNYVPSNAKDDNVAIEVPMLRAERRGNAGGQR
jgi:hypothetical protein